jgi:hypothetical protein
MKELNRRLMDLEGKILAQKEQYVDQHYVWKHPWE